MKSKLNEKYLDDVLEDLIEQMDEETRALHKILKAFSKDEGSSDEDERNT